MNTPNPLIPQGSLPTRGKSTVRIAFFTILLIHVVFIGGLLIIGCSKEEPITTTDAQPPVTEPATEASNSVATPAPSGTETSAPVAVAPGTSATGAAPAPQPAAQAPVTPPPPPEPVAPPPAVGTEYSIAKGDMLENIAKKHGVSLKALLDANPGVNPKRLKIGQKLQIPAATAAPVAPQAAEANLGDSSIYVVKSGDMLEKIAKTHGTTAKAIATLNNLKSVNSIKPGQKLKMPAPKAAAPAPAAQPPAPPVPSAPPAPAPAPSAPAPTNQ